ncbi:MAG TPA: DoxX family protein [Acidimicrobiia bacterium]|jgi:putative oxidoreductase
MDATLRDHALLGLRAVVGGSLAAHGAQKLFGAFGGGGPESTAKAFEEHMHLEPGEAMARLAGGTELGSGLATALGVGGPIGPTAMAATMTVAALTAHRGKPYFGQMGGPEMPLLYAANGAFLALAGFGRDSLDRGMGLRVPKSIGVVHAALAAAAAAAIVSRAWRAQDAANAQPRAAVDEHEPEQPQARLQARGA